MYRSSQNWFKFSEIKSELHRFLDPERELCMLEIGTFEGLSTTFIGDNYLNKSNSSLDAVDPFLYIDDNDHEQYLKDVENKFDYNVSISQNKDKISVHKITSDEFFKTCNKKYDFIYIDGCHLCDFIQRDMENSFERLNVNGIMWMDDYLGGSVGDDSIKDTMDKFLESNKSKLTIIHNGYQLAIKKD